MEWLRQIRFVAAVPMPSCGADRVGTTVNGMWADPARFSAEEVAERQTSGERGLDRWLDDGRLTVDVPELRECAVVLVEPNQGRFVR